MVTILPQDLDTVLDNDGPTHIALSRLEDDTGTVLRRRQPLLLVESNSGAFTALIDALRPHVGIFIDRLLRAPDLIIGDELQQVVDFGLYNPQLSMIFETLWIARFEHAEQRDPAATLHTLLRMTFDEPSLFVRTDALLFWLTLFHQNEVNTHGQVILFLTHPAGLDTDIMTFIRTAETWSAFGSPVRIVTLAAAFNWPS